MQVGQLVTVCRQVTVKVITDLTLCKFKWCILRGTPISFVGGGKCSVKGWACPGTQCFLEKKNYNCEKRPPFSRPSCVLMVDDKLNLMNWEDTVLPGLL